MQRISRLKSRKNCPNYFHFTLFRQSAALVNDGTQDNSLSSLISDFFDMSEDELDPSVSEKVKELTSIVENRQQKSPTTK